ncbi:MAG: DEAD/DEAH box helicase family protein [Clostridium sp.]|nr:DEAD/DEAH box helicase family protein [Clostridium sp.]
MAKSKEKIINESEFLYYRIESIKEVYPSFKFKDIPPYIINNLSNRFVMRDYQKEAFQYTFHYIDEMVKNKQIHLLYHMATGSGKTYIMAGLILYFYKKGYRNFIFFVNQGNIVEKTKENFLNKEFSKYLFAEKIIIDGEVVDINLVENFQGYDENNINIKFTTIQQLHIDLQKNKEGNTTLKDYEDAKMVIIADEAHHINSDTKKKLTKDEVKSKESWEKSVNKVYRANKDNVMLEFTATCDLKNENIVEKYNDKIVFNYPLLKYREDGYTKEFLNLQSNLSPMHRVVQAMLLSQYRLKLFEKYGKVIKPAILLKSKIIEENKAFFQEFILYMNNDFSEKDINLIRTGCAGVIKTMFKYFSDNDVSDNMLVYELKQAFSKEHLIIMDSKDKDVSEKQKLVNNLESKDNPYRMIFTVDMLNEGWDVLNLYDIVRLYETRQGGNKISQTTITEAQLIGRGVRYCPFKIKENDEMFKRKYDSDVENELRICETLYYHSMQDSRYIDELRQALKEIGLEPKEVIEFSYKVKESFKEKDIYKTGKLFKNDIINKGKDRIISIPSNFYFISEINFTKQFKEVGLADNKTKTSIEFKDCIETEVIVSEFAKTNYPIILKALRVYPIYRFNKLQSYFPHLKSIKEFITSDNYAGRFKTKLTTVSTPNNLEYYKALLDLFGKLADKIATIKDEFEGTTEFIEVDLKKYVKDTDRKKMNPDKEGEGISQNSVSVKEEYRLDLYDNDWFVYEDNYGTTEEKKFVKFFSEKVNKLKEIYDEVYLIRNERNLHIYSFNDGARFEPDYILLLKKNNEIKYEQQQIFVEPKGSHLLKNDAWKEEFMLQMETMATTKCYHNDLDEYKVLGLPFFNQDKKLKEFDEAFINLLLPDKSKVN